MKKRILLVMNEPLRRGGSQAVIMSVVKNLSDRYCFDILLGSNADGWYDEEFCACGGRIIRLPNYSGSNPIRLRADLYLRWIWRAAQVRRVLADGGYYAVHCINGFESGYVLREACKSGVKRRIANVVVIVKANKLRKIFNSFWLRRIKKYATDMIGPSEESCLSMFGEGSGYKVLLNPYDGRFDPSLYERVVADGPKLIHIASYGSNKNQLFTVDVFGHLLGLCPAAELTFVGFDAEAGYFERLQQEVQRRGLDGKVRFEPHDADTPRLLSASTCLMLPSKSESFGIVLVEAQAMGDRCYVSDSVPRLADVGGCTFLPLGDGAEKWAARIAADFKATGGAAGAYDCSRFSEAAVAEQYRRLYEGEL